MKLALEKSMAALANNQDSDGEVFVRINIDKNEDENFLKMSTMGQVIPMLFFEGAGLSSSLWQASFFAQVKERHISVLKKLKAHGYKKVVIAADNDGLLARMLSPRFSDWSMKERMTLLLDIFTDSQKIIDELWVALTIEELIPGGMDATDGIEVSKNLQSLGLKTLIVASGTKDFMPLYARKTTKKKVSQEEEFASHEPSLASCLWVRETTTLELWALADIDEPKDALDLAQSLGLSGIIIRL